MNYLKSYENEAAYLADATEARMKSGDFLLPNVSFVKDTKAVHYNKYREFQSVGDIYVSDGTNNWFVKPSVYETSYANNENITPIGILVVPKEHMTDNKHRVMSLVHMDCTNPKSGTSDNPSMYWGNGTLILTSLYDRAYITAGTTITNFNIVNFANEDGEASSQYIIQSPYGEDGISKNENYLSNIYCPTCDLDGETNTNTIINNVTADWSGSTITNSTSRGNYPVACCCKRFHTSGTNAGDWYLPAFGELGYVYSKNKTINSTIQLLKNLGKTVADFAYASPTSTATNINSYVSYNIQSYFSINLSTGSTREQDTYSRTTNSVRAFLKV